MRAEHMHLVVWQQSDAAACSINFGNRNNFSEKKALGETQTLRTGGAKKSRPTADPIAGGVGRPKFNQPKIVTNFTYRPR